MSQSLYLQSRGRQSNFDQGFQAQPCDSNCKSNFVVGLKGVGDSSKSVDGCEALRAITI